MQFVTRQKEILFLAWEKAKVLWHRKNSDLPNAVSQSLRIQLAALAPKKPLLTKRRKPKPTNSAYAEFGKKNAGFKGGKTFQSENRHTVPRILLCRILEFFAFAEKNAVSLAKSDCKGGQNGHVDRTLVSGDILRRWQK